MLPIVVAIEAAFISSRARARYLKPERAHRHLRDGGQATAEYALVLLGVAAVALLLLAWATKSGKLGELFDAVVDNLIGKVR